MVWVTHAHSAQEIGRKLLDGFGFRVVRIVGAGAEAAVWQIDGFIQNPTSGLMTSFAIRAATDS
jgi:hypothetical protein